MFGIWRRKIDKNGNQIDYTATEKDFLKHYANVDNKKKVCEEACMNYIKLFAMRPKTVPISIKEFIEETSKENVAAKEKAKVQDLNSGDLLAVIGKRINESINQEYSEIMKKVLTPSFTFEECVKTCMSRWDPLQAECVKQSMSQKKADNCMQLNERIKEKTLAQWKND